MGTMQDYQPIPLLLKIKTELPPSSVIAISNADLPEESRSYRGCEFHSTAYCVSAMHSPSHADLFATCPMPVVPLGLYSLLLGNNWTITLHNLFTSWLCLMLQAPSNPLAAKGIQQSPFFEVICSQLSSWLPWEINARLQRVRISHQAFCLCFAFLSQLLSEKNRTMTASFISLSFPCIPKEGKFHLLMLIESTETCR